MQSKVFHIGVFFDGTGNNKVYDNNKNDGSLTNIAKLSELYIQSEGEIKDKYGKDIYSAMVYENGVGTYDNEKQRSSNPIDRKYDLEAGGGGSLRINSAIDQVKGFIKNYSQEHALNKFNEYNIDVFGFSRGAALARDFINTFNSKNKKTWRFKNITFNFVGLYDTVSSFGIAGNGTNRKPRNQNEFSETADDFKFWDNSDSKNNEIVRKKELIFILEDAKQRVAQLESEGWSVSISISEGNIPSYLVSSSIEQKKLYENYNFHLSNYSARKIVHMVSYDEARKNFPLNSCCGEELTFLGVHSDIGGGYEDEVEEEYFPFSLDDTLENHEKIEKARKNYWEVKKYTAETARLISKVHSYYTFTKKRKVTNDLSKVTLHLMHEEALKYDVPFKDIPNKKDYKLTTHVKKYYEYIKKNKRAAINFIFEDKSINKYRHFSGVDTFKRNSRYKGKQISENIIYSEQPSLIEGNDLRYINNKGIVIEDINDADKEDVLYVKREVYKNNPDLAIEPLRNY